ncbi:hypothetical protein SCALM49S_02435 [Streptomyces californicus]
MHPAAFAGAVVGRITHYALSGTAGVLVLRGAAKAAPKAKPAARRLLVSGIAGGITTRARLGRAAEARLKAGDLLAEAKEQLGEDGAAALGGRCRGARPRPPALSRRSPRSSGPSASGDVPVPGYDSAPVSGSSGGVVVHAPPPRAAYG